MNHNPKTIILDMSIIIILAVTLLFLVNPFEWWMPSYLAMLLVAIFTAGVGVGLAVFWKEQSGDERDAVHMMFAGRVAFFTGTMFIAIAIIAQSIQHDLDPWLPVILLAMLVSKYVSRMYAQVRK